MWDIYRKPFFGNYELFCICTATFTFSLIGFFQQITRLDKHNSFKRIVFISATSCDATSTLAPTTQPSTPCLTYTTGGNAKGAFCQFPFRYKGRAYYECTRRDNRKSWCSTTPDYDTDQTWGVCSGSSSYIALFRISTDWNMIFLMKGFKAINLYFRYCVYCSKYTL